MNKVILWLAIVVAIGGITVSSVVGMQDAENLNAKKEYKFKCSRTGQVFTFETPGNKKCPTHNDHSLIPIN